MQHFVQQEESYASWNALSGSSIRRGEIGALYEGAIYDVIIDLRPGSSTFKQWVAVELSAENRRMLYIPEGFAHGFLTLDDNTEIFYQMSEFYAPAYARGVRWNDPAFCH